MWRKQLPILLLVFLCTPFQASVATCGDGLREENEQCEDGNQVKHLFRLRLAVHATLGASGFRIEQVEYSIMTACAQKRPACLQCRVL